MYKNYFYFRRLSLELYGLLSGAALASIFTQEKDKLVLLLIKSGSEFVVEISVNQSDPYVIYKESYKRAKKNSFDFANTTLPQAFSNIEIAKSERIIKFSFGTLKVIFILRGKNTNVLFVEDGSSVSSFKSSGKGFLELIKTELESTEFQNPSEPYNLTLDTKIKLDQIKKSHPMLGKEIILECTLRNEKNPLVEIDKLIIGAINEVLTSPIAVIIDRQTLDQYFAPLNFHIYPLGEINQFKSYIEAINFFFRQRYKNQEFTKLSKTISKYFDKELGYLSGKINDLQSRVSKGCREEEYSKFANLLLIELNNITKGSKEIVLNDIYCDGEMIKIPLRVDLSPKKNVDNYFEKARNEKINFKISQKILAESIKRFEILVSEKYIYEKACTMDELKMIKSELNLKEQRQDEATDNLYTKFKRYLIESKYEFYVGKDSTNNDLLTMKFAKQNDYWFHARSVSGSHCVLKIHNTKEPVPKSVLKKAASIAAFHSKAKTAGVVPVSYTFKKYVVKKKGLDVGQVVLLKEDVLLVKPEIPAGVEFLAID